MSFLEIVRGDSPLLLGLPHTGTDLPGDIAARLNATGRALADTDWHVHRLYDGLHDVLHDGPLAGVTTIRTRIHRYVIDVNRDPGGASLYPGQNTTGLCPTTDFDGRPIWRDGAAPDTDEIERLRMEYHAPYHAALAAELDRIRAAHGFAILYDCHSIRSRIPFLFEGELPVLNIGTNDGAACAPALETAAWEIAAAAPFSAVRNGRFRGGWTTRHHGAPGAGIHALQMELAQRAYLAAEAPPWRYDTGRADALRPWLGRILAALVATATELHR